MISSTPPDAPRRCPSSLLVLETDQLPGVRAEDVLHRLGLGQVAQPGAGAVGVDVVDGLGRQLGLVDAELHGTGAPRPSSSGAVMCTPSDDTP